ncbi:MAG: hypothetical protein MR661_08145 [Prevotella sp.]|nr:hypothetical protein [Prevotella sp.]MCI6309314.1 hypothetical protein [Prevotella sp.]MDY3272377.1 hypothetical protein [Prevotella sp.]
MWQYIISALIITAAVACAAWKIYLLVRGKTSPCDGCHGCAHKAEGCANKAKGCCGNHALTGKPHCYQKKEDEKFGGIK